MFSVSGEGPDLGRFGGRTQKGEIWEKQPRSKQHTEERCFLKDVPRKQAKSLKNTSEGVHP